MKKIVITTIIAVTVTILLLSVVGKSQIEAEQSERAQPIITTAAVTTTLEAKEKITTIPVITKTKTSIITIAPALTTTAITTTSITTSEVTNTTTAPTTIEKEITTTTQPPLKVVTTETTPENGTIKGDKIWIMGFGWVKNEGGGGEGTYDHEMKTNGNKIGCFG